MSSEPEKQEKQMPVRRKSHPKSRTGCKTCKSRKIKCDEHIPCRNCIRHSVRCDFLSNVPSPGPDSSIQPGGDLAIHDLELLHNFTTKTYASLSEVTEIRDLYRITAVQLGFKHDYLLRTILGMSALHLAHYRPAQRDHYMYLAMRHHQVATRSAVAIMSQALDPDGAEPLFFFSTLTSFFSIASSCSDYEQRASLAQEEETGMPNWIFLPSGTRVITMFLLNRPSAESGPLGIIFSDGRQRIEMREKAKALKREREAEASRTPSSAGDGSVVDDHNVHDHLNRVQELTERFETDEALRDIYTKAIEGLHQTFDVVTAASRPDDSTDSFVWLFMVADDLVPLLRAPKGPKQEALVLMTFFAALVKKLDGKWWARGCGEQLLRRAYAQLDGQHRLWVHWPIEDMGWIPPV